MSRFFAPALAGLLVFGLSATTPARAAGFDCAKAKTPTEKAICADAFLSELDGHLARYYAAAAEDLGDGATCLKADQRQWVKAVRDACAAKTACLKTAYLERLGALDALQPGASALTSIDLPAVPALAAAIPPEAEAEASGAKSPLSITGRLLHEQTDINQMGYAIKPDKGPVRAFVLDMEIGASPNHERVAALIRDEPQGRFTVRGMATADGNFAGDQCRFVFRN